MIEIRIHGRGGQGNVVAAYLLAAAAFEEGLACQAFPSFGAERRGAPVVAFVRIDSRPIQRRCEVREPSFLIVQDQGLLHLPAITEGLRPQGGILVNSAKDSAFWSGEIGRPVTTMPASALATEVVGRPLPNVALLAGFLALTGLLPTEALAKAVGARFRGDVAARNLALIERAWATVPAGAWREVADAPGA